MNASAIMASLVLGLATVCQTEMRCSAAESEQPQLPTVAVLPIINRSPEKDPHFRQEMIKSASEFLPKGFLANGFQPLSPEVVAGAITKAQADLTDEESYRRETFLKIGEAAGADFVYFATIEENGYFSANTGRVTLRVWFLGVKDKARILSARSVAGESKARVGGGPMHAQVVAASRAAEESLQLAQSVLGKPYVKPPE